MSGAFGSDAPSLTVLTVSSNDFEIRSTLTFGYLASNCLLSSSICAFWPPRTSWSQIVNVTSPSAAMSGLAAAVAAGVA